MTWNPLSRAIDLNPFSDIDFGEQARQRDFVRHVLPWIDGRWSASPETIIRALVEDRS